MNRSRLILLTIAAAVVCLALSACGGGSDATPTPTLSALDLAPLVLPVQQVVVDATTLTFSAKDSGQRERNDMLDGSFNHDRDSAELDTYGWHGGYKQVFREANDDQIGVFFAEASLNLADTSAHATQVLSVQLTDNESDVGKTSTDSTGTKLKLVSIDKFAPSSVNGANGTIAKVEVDGTPFYLTNVTFARGPVVATMTTASYDDRDLKTATEELAKQLETQVGTVVKP
jgi:hypothetical protein